MHTVVGKGGREPKGGERGGGAGKQRQKKSSAIKYHMRIFDKGLTSQQWTHKKGFIVSKKQKNAKMCKINKGKSI